MLNIRNLKIRLTGGIGVFKILTFIFLYSVSTGTVFHSDALTPLEIGKEALKNADGMDSIRPSWCPRNEDPGLSTVCGTILSAKLVTDERDNISKIPIPKVTVEIYEQNPLSPTGKISGNLVNIFSSTVGDDAGNFNITMRKKGSPNLKAYLVIKCGGEVERIREVDTWHDYYNLEFDVDCPYSEFYEYATPTSFPSTGLPLVKNSTVLGCVYEPVSALPTGMKDKPEPATNTVITSENFDHRYGKNKFKLNTNVSISGKLLNLEFSSSGGWWEPDCLLNEDINPIKKDIWVCGLEVESGTPYETCMDKYDNEVDIQLGDKVLCDPGAEAMPPEDRLTRPFYVFIPKTPVEEPFRRLDIRTNLTDYIEDPYFGMAAACRLTGCRSIDPVAAPAVHFREYQADDSGDNVQLCEELGKAGASLSKDETSKNSYLNGAVAGGLASPTLDWKYMLDEILNCDPVITDAANPLFCDLRKPTDTVCNAPELGRETKDFNEDGFIRLETRDYNGDGSIDDTELTENFGIQLCEIQPDFMGTNSNCEIGDPDCAGPCGYGVTKKYVLPQKYFNVDIPFKGGTTFVNTLSYAFNDSANYDKGDRPEEFALFSTETAEGQQNKEESRSIASQGGANNTGSKNTAYSITNIQEFVGAIDQSITTPLIAPYSTFEDSYKPYSVWKIYMIGNPRPLCGLGQPYHTNVILGPEQEKDIQIDNIFQGQGKDTSEDDLGTGQLRSKTATTSTWYMGENSIKRDEYLSAPAVAMYFWPLIGIDNSPIDTTLTISMAARDIWDSLLSMGEGTVTLHYDGDGFVFSFSDVITTTVNAIFSDSIGDPSKAKTFGHRTTDFDTDDITPKPYYDVTHPLSDLAFGPDNATDDFGVTEEVFLLPDWETEFTTDSWGVHMCYSWRDIGSPAITDSGDDGSWGTVDDESTGGICGTYRQPIEGPAGTIEECGGLNIESDTTCSVSRTCRVAECKDVYAQVEVVKCTCDSPKDLNCTVGDPYWDLTKLSDTCTVADRYICAHEEKTNVLIKSNRGESMVPEEIVCSGDPYLCSPCRNLDPYTGEVTYDSPCLYQSTPLPYIEPAYDPPGVDITDCTVDLFDWSDKDNWEVYVYGCVLWDYGFTPPICVEYSYYWRDAANGECDEDGDRVDCKLQANDVYCVDGFDCKYVGGDKTTDLTGAPGRRRPTCSVDKAGPMLGGPGCNGALTIGDFTTRLEQYPPNESYTSEAPEDTWKELDSINESLIIADQALGTPYSTPIGGAGIALKDTSSTDVGVALNQDPITAYTKGVEVPTIGRGHYGEQSAHSVAPYFNTKTTLDSLEPLYYHCRTGISYTPARGEFADIYATFDPDFGTYDDNGDGCPDSCTDDSQLALDVGWTCSIEPPPNTDWGVLDNAGGTCAVPATKMVGSCYAALGGTVSLTFFNVINLAANAAQVPAAAILAVMAQEATLLGETQVMEYWADDYKVYSWSVPWFGRIDGGGNVTCDENLWSATGPFSIFQNTWNNFLNTPAFIDALESIYPGRAATASRCNLLDGAIMVGLHLKPVPYTGDFCGGGFDLVSALGNYSGGSYTDISRGLSVYEACR